MSNVKLAIRVRPFADRELRSEKERIPVVNIIDDYTVTITNVKVSASGAGDSRERVRSYTADYTFDSACATSDERYASQDTVFNAIGRDVLSSLRHGASCCVLAYGQSATGKTHTMMGVDSQPGLVPRLCCALLDDGGEVAVSFLEIYNERVHDLLVGEELPACGSLPRRRGNARKDLRVREHPSRGTYVQNLRRVVVTDASTLLGLVSDGARRRRTAATRRNSSSSRSHAILELATSRATLHLADLAGRMCSGSLLTPTWTLTAGHCLLEFTFLALIPISLPKVIRYGDFQELQTKTKKLSKVLKEFQHPQFVSKMKAMILNDIALLMVEAVPTGAFVKLSVVDYRSLGGQRGQLAGFSPYFYEGNLTKQSKGNTRPLQVLDVIIDQCETLKYLDTTIGKQAGPVICVMGKCGGLYLATEGDSGGPLVHDGRLVGVASFAPGVLEKGLFVGAYTPVSPYISWIQEVIATNRENSSSDDINKRLRAVISS